MTTLRRLLLILAVLFVFGASQAALAGPSIVAGDGPVDLATQTTVTITGNGFQAGQEVNLVLHFPDGTKNDLGWALDPAPKADDRGTWKTTFDGARYIKKKLIKAGEYMLDAVDSEYSTICSSAIVFTGEPKKKKKKKKIVQ